MRGSMIAVNIIANNEKGNKAIEEILEIFSECQDKVVKWCKDI